MNEATDTQMKATIDTPKRGLPLAATPLFALDEWLQLHPKAQITFYPWGRRFGHGRTFTAISVTISRKSLEACCPGQLSIGLDIASVDVGPNGITARDSWGDVVVEANG